ncbi:uncharacterized protein V1518DRAFT_424462 [Limtongia smithiae]|uniref:uncharacterized protein n=1 Tax=Limtongia smithiae TaxID=1125753 RepID=UPI0034CFD6E4
MAPKTEQRLVRVPLVYRVLFLWFEPLAAFTGSIVIHNDPAKFLRALSAVGDYAPSNRVVYNNLCATYTLFAFNEGILLRRTNDLKVWRTVLIGILICDALHLSASWAELGSALFWNPLAWRGDDWINLGSLWGQAFMRVLFLFGVGLKGNVSTVTVDVVKKDM